MVKVTSSAAGDGVAEKKCVLASLYHRLKFVEIATGTDDASSLLWPCLEFEESSNITPEVKKAINMSGQESMALVLSTLRRMSSNQGTKGPVALLLGKTVPNQNRCIWFQGELLSFMDNFFTGIQSSEDVADLKEAMQVTGSIVEAAMSSANDSTNAVGQSDAIVTLDAPPSNKAAAVENPLDQSNAVEANSAALNTSSSNDEEATVPQKASIDSLPKVDEAIAPKESSIKSKPDVVQPGKTRASSSKEEEVIVAKEPSIEAIQNVVPLTTKTRARRRASSTRKRPKTAKAARVSMDAALTAEETLQSEQDSPVADSSTTASTQTRRTKHSSGSKRKSPPTVALTSVKKEGAPSTQSKKSKTTPLSEAVIPSFEEVRKSLKKGGYVFRDGIYCRPGMDPTKNTKAQLGEGYFEDEQSFRKHLCAYGVDGDRGKWTKDDATLIKDWVRYTVVKSVSGEGGKVEYEPLDGARATNFLLRRLGFRIQKGLQDVIVLPDVPKGEEVVDVNCFVYGQHGIWSHLARSGLPEKCYLSGVSDRDMLSLELYVSSNAEINTFGKVQGHDNATSPGVSPSQSNVSSGGRSTRSLRKRSVDDNATTITADSVGVGMRKIVKKKPNTGKDKKKKGRPAKATTASSTKKSTTKKGRPAKATTASSTKQSTTLRVSIPAISPVSQSPVGRQLFGSLSPKIEAETNPLPEIEGTAEEKLTASLDALKMTNQAENNSFYRLGTHFASNLKTILKFLCASIESEGGHGGTQGEPAALYVCGVPGIGKTSGVKWCCAKAIEETTSDSDYEGPTPTVVNINAGHMSSASKPEVILLEELARGVGMTNPEKQKKNNILKHIKKTNQMVLVVVDEIDLLVSASSQMLEGRRPGTEGVIQTLLGYAQDEMMPLALIGISNSSANEKYHRLNEIGKFKDTVTFKSYSKDDLIGIVQARIGRKIVAPNALEFIAKKVEQNTGDARSALEMTVKAIERRLSVVRDGCSLPADQNAPLVTMADVMPAVKKSNAKIAETIEGLPTMGKAILCVLTTLARAGSKSTTLGNLKRFASDAMSENHQEEVLTLDDFKALVETLTDTGLLSMQGNMGGNLHILPISLGLQLEDVEVAIANGLGKERFYEKLCEFTKKNMDRLLSKR